MVSFFLVSSRNPGEIIHFDKHIFKWIGSTTYGFSFSKFYGKKRCKLLLNDIRFEMSFLYLTSKRAAQKRRVQILGGGFKHFLFSPLLGEDFQFD